MVNLINQQHVACFRLFTPLVKEKYKTLYYQQTDIIMKTKAFFTLLVLSLFAVASAAQDNPDYDLFVAANNGDVNSISTLIEGGVNPNITDQYGNTPLYYAAINNRAGAVTTLAELGALINTSNESENSALIAATNMDYYDVVEALLAAGADPDFERADGMTAVHVAALKGHYHSLLHLIINNAEVNKISNTGVTPLMLATSKGHKHIVQMLLENQAIDLTNDQGQNALSWAKTSGEMEIAKLIETTSTAF